MAPSKHTIPADTGSLGANVNDSLEAVVAGSLEADVSNKVGVLPIEIQCINPSISNNYQSLNTVIVALPEESTHFRFLVYFGPPSSS